jgi:hypothetical protein
MPVFKREDAIGYRVGERVYHPDCFQRIKTPPEFIDVVRAEETEKHIIICDECGKEIE